MKTIIDLFLSCLIFKVLLNILLLKTSLGRFYLHSNIRRSLRSHKRKFKKRIIKNIKKIRGYLFKRLVIMRDVMGNINIKNIRDIFRNVGSNKNIINRQDKISCNCEDVINLKKYKESKAK